MFQSNFNSKLSNKEKRKKKKTKMFIYSVIRDKLKMADIQYFLLYKNTSGTAATSINFLVYKTQIDFIYIYI